LNATKSATRGHLDSNTAAPLFSRTGNPFVDSGLAALCALSKRSTPEEITKKDLKKQLKYIAKIYSQKEWRKAIHGMIFPNADLVNPSVKDGPLRYERALENYLTQAAPIDGVGDCVACGCRDGIIVNKTRVPLLGSGKLVNYFPSGMIGERFCPNCILAIQFFLLAIEKVGRPLMLHTTCWPIQLAYAERIVRHIKRSTAANKGGILNMGYRMVAGINAVYDAITEIAQNKEIRAMPTNRLVTSLRFYHFTNYGQSPDVDFYDIPSNVFEFLIEIRRHAMKHEWLKVVRRGYIKPKRKSKDDISKTTMNRVYRALTDGTSILRFFFTEEEFQVIGNWDLLSFYLRKVRRMEQKRIEVLKQVADCFLEYCKKTGSAKRITQLHYARSYRDFRSVLLKVQQELTQASGESLVSFDQYVLDIAPEGGRYWNETRDLLLFRIYEKGGSWLSSKREELEIPEPEDESS